MADAVTIIRAPEEPMSKFNIRMLDVCKEMPVTSAQLAVVDGQPCVTLFAEAVEAEQEDVEEAGEAASIKVGDLIPAEEPVYVQVCPLHADNLEKAATSQKRMETLYKRAQGGVTAVLHASGKGVVRVQDPVTKKEIFVEKDCHYVAVVYNPLEGDESSMDEGTPANG